MVDNIVALRSASLSLSRITYNSNLSRADAFVIPLGVMAEITLGTRRVLGLIARTELSEGEMATVGSLFRDKLRAPFELLKSEFDWACANTQANKALEVMSERHANSFLFSVPIVKTIRNAQTSSNGAAAAEYVRAELRTQRDQEFFQLLDECWGTPDSVPPMEDISKLVA